MWSVAKQEVKWSREAGSGKLVELGVPRLTSRALVVMDVGKFESCKAEGG